MAIHSPLLKDPLGNRVRFLAAACRPAPGPITEEQMELTISRPAMILSSDPAATAERFYFRSLDWNTTLLLIVGLEDEVWTTRSCIWNPDPSLLTDLIRKGRQLL